MSLIEQYNYEGELIRAMNLDFIATKMQFDKIGNRLLFLSVDNEDVHVGVL